MKKTIALISLLVLMLWLVGCNKKTVNINFPFEVGDVETIELYRYAGAPVSAEKKVVDAEETTGAKITSFRFNLSDGTTYELIYGCYGVKTGNLKSSTGNFEYFTSEDIGAYWSDIDLEAVAVEESELPK